MWAGWPRHATRAESVAILSVASLWVFFSQSAAWFLKWLEFEGAPQGLVVLAHEAVFPQPRGVHTPGGDPGVNRELDARAGLWDVVRGRRDGSDLRGQTGTRGAGRAGLSRTRAESRTGHRVPPHICPPV